MRQVYYCTIFFFFICFFCACGENKKVLFTLIPATETGIDFSNTITENDSINVLDYEYVYNGSGVGVGDFNNDGLQDLYFSANMVRNALYINKGGMHFQDVTKPSGTGGEGKWCTGVAIVDINNDG